jgi:hypothetical protein
VQLNYKKDGQDDRQTLKILNS